MNVAELEILEAVRRTLAAVPGVRLARLVRAGETPKTEIPLSRLPAAIIEPVATEILAWPEVPAGRYSLLHWRASILDRAIPETRAFDALVRLAEVCRQAIGSSEIFGDLCQDGPPSARDASLCPAAGATRLGHLWLEEVAPGRPTALAFHAASGSWTELQTAVATIDDEELFSSGPHVVLVGTPLRHVQDQAFSSLSGGLALDLGDGPREVTQRGVLSAASAGGLALLEAAVESFIDGRTYTVGTPAGTNLPNCRLERFDRLGPPLVGAAWHQPYRIMYRQIAR